MTSRLACDVSMSEEEELRRQVDHTWNNPDVPAAARSSVASQGQPTMNSRPGDGEQESGQDNLAEAEEVVARIFTAASERRQQQARGAASTARKRMRDHQRGEEEEEEEEEEEARHWNYFALDQELFRTPKPTRTPTPTPTSTSTTTSTPTATSTEQFWAFPTSSALCPAFKNPGARQCQASARTMV